MELVDAIYIWFTKTNHTSNAWVIFIDKYDLHLNQTIIQKLLKQSMTMDGMKEYNNYIKMRDEIDKSWNR